MNMNMFKNYFFYKCDEYDHNYDHVHLKKNFKSSIMKFVT